MNERGCGTSTGNEISPPEQRYATMPVHDFMYPASTALLVVDMQNAFVEPEAPLASPFALAILPGIAALARQVRSAGGTVAWTRHSWSDDPARANPAWFNDLVGPETVKHLKALVPGGAPHAIHPGLEVDERDIVVDKFGRALSCRTTPGCTTSCRSAAWRLSSSAARSPALLPGDSKGRANARLPRLLSS